MNFLSGKLTCSLALLFLLFFLSQCAQIYRPELLSSSSTMSGKDLERLGEITKKHPDPSMRADAHLQLAAYYSNHKNANYSAALKELESYVALDPEGGKKENIQNWLAMLREFEKTKSKLKELKDSMERLKTLDIKIEEKRKKVK